MRVVDVLHSAIGVLQDGLFSGGEDFFQVKREAGQMMSEQATPSMRTTDR